MNIFSYIVTVDTGFSPNPYHGICTLACCKPGIRQYAKLGDWVVGLRPKREGHGLVYAMRVSAGISFEDYWNQKQYAAKKPRFDTPENSAGDNIYEPLPKGGFKQYRSMHSQKSRHTRLPIASEDEENKKRDLSVHRVLTAEEFVYWGGNGPDLCPELLQGLVVGHGYKRIDSPDLLQRWDRFIQEIPKESRGIQGEPKHLHKMRLCHDCGKRQKAHLPKKIKICLSHKE